MRARGDYVPQARVVLSCPHCGGGVPVEEGLDLTACSYCASALIIDRPSEDEVLVEQPRYENPNQLVRSVIDARIREYELSKPDDDVDLDMLELAARVGGRALEVHPGIGAAIIAAGAVAVAANKYRDHRRRKAIHDSCRVVSCDAVWAPFEHEVGAQVQIALCRRGDELPRRPPIDFVCCDPDHARRACVQRPIPRSRRRDCRDASAQADRL